MGVALTKGLHTGFNNVLGRIEVGLADLQMNDLLALGFQHPGFRQHFESGLCTQIHHPAG